MRWNEVGRYGVDDILLPLCPAHSEAQWPELVLLSTTNRQRRVVELGPVGTLQPLLPFCELLSLLCSSKGCDSLMLPLSAETEGYYSPQCQWGTVNALLLWGRCQWAGGGGQHLPRCLQWVSAHFCLGAVRRWMCAHTYCLCCTSAGVGVLPAKRKTKWDAESYDVISKRIH